MSREQRSRRANFVQLVKQFAVSAFVILTFAAYSIHDRTSEGDGPVAAAPTLSSERDEVSTQPLVSPTVAVPTSLIQPAATATTPPTSIPASPTIVPSPTIPRSGYQDGQYTGVLADAFYGFVQVKAIIQDGKIMDVQFLEYPQDRRTSARINSRAVPALRREAIQVQNAQVDIISGATLTSEAFIQSLQSALDQAKF
jgi:uncharacterized protein with FMN-binding domain